MQLRLAIALVCSGVLMVVCRAGAGWPCMLRAQLCGLCSAIYDQPRHVITAWFGDESNGHGDIGYAWVLMGSYHLYFGKANGSASCCYNWPFAMHLLAWKLILLVNVWRRVL